MDEDFFKDYPVRDGGDEAGAGATPGGGEGADDGAGAFVLGYSEANGNGEATPAIPMGHGGPPPDEEAEPECAAVSEWRAAFAKGLEEKVSSERAIKAERAEKAKQTLATMHARWDNGAKDALERNKKSEREFIRERDGVISRMSKPGMKPSWDIVPQLVDMTGKYKEGARDTSRMRQVLMRMKTD